MATTLIAEGKVVDGTGAAAFPGSILVDGDRIAAVVRRGEALPEAERVIDAGGKVIAPGFIDMHSHADWLLANAAHDSLFASLLEQGVTTVVGGNCGISPAPVDPQRTAPLERLAAIAIEQPLAYSWRTMAEFLAAAAASPPPVNVAELVGHAALRYANAETRRGPMAPDELAAALRATRAALDEGACGVSFGLGYDPGMYSSIEEVAAFAAVAAAADRPITVHVKALSRISPSYPVTSVGAHNVRAISEILAVARATGVRLQLSHFLFVGRRSWSTAERCLDLVDRARRDGVDVMIDAFPFTCGNTTVNVVMPYWYLADLRHTQRSRWARARLRVELEAGFRLLGFGLGDFQLMNPGVAAWNDLCGLTVPEIGQRWGMSPFAALIEISRESRGAAVMLFQKYSGEPGREEALEAVLRCDHCLIETDAVLRAHGHPNPAALGTFPRVLGRYVRKRRLFGLEAAIRRMTGASADRFGLGDRGRLVAGKAADIVIFDPATIEDSTPRGGAAGRPLGIDQVFVNGVVAVEGGRTCARASAGRVLRC